MDTLRQLSATDTLFIAAETESVYNHTGGLVLLGRRGRQALTFKQFRHYAEQRISQIPHFHWKLHEVPLGLDLPYWVEDETFSYDRHIRRIAVPSPGDDRALAEVAAFLYSRKMDHRKPLWEIWFIEGLKGGKTAVLQKLHHCLMDGQGAIKLAGIMFDADAKSSPVNLDESITGARAGRVPGQWEQSLRAALKYARMPGAGTTTVADIFRSRLASTLKKKHAKNRPKVSPVKASFNAEVSRERGYVFGSLPFADIKFVAEQHKVSINDVVLALVGGALRAYLRSRKDLPQEALRALMAVSLRSSGDEEFSNQVTNAPVTLATNIASPRGRLQAISRDTQEAKQSVKSGGKGAMEIFEMMPPALISSINALVNAEQTVQMLGANLVVSNLRGSEKPQYLAGARIKATYPLSVLSNGITINFTCMSYNGKMDFGVILDPELFPQPWSIIEGLVTELDEYMALAKKIATRTRKSPAGNKAGAGKGAKK
jgi:WS/DGAT/MGAT family acyltransferase